MGAEPRAAAARRRDEPGNSRVFTQEAKAEQSQGQKHFARLRLPVAPDIGTGKAPVATDLKRSTTGHSAELHCQGVGKKKKNRKSENQQALGPVYLLQASILLEDITAAGSQLSCAARGRRNSSHN